MRKSEKDKLKEPNIGEVGHCGGLKPGTRSVCTAVGLPGSKEALILMQGMPRIPAPHTTLCSPVLQGRVYFHDEGQGWTLCFPPPCTLAERLHPQQWGNSDPPALGRITQCMQTPHNWKQLVLRQHRGTGNVFLPPPGLFHGAPEPGLEEFSGVHDLSS